MDGRSIPEYAQHLDEQAYANIQAFMVLDAAPSLKRLPGEIKQILQRLGSATMCIQRLVPADGPALGSSMEALHRYFEFEEEGEPQPVTILGLASWEILRSCLRRWEV